MNHFLNPRMNELKLYDMLNQLHLTNRHWFDKSAQKHKGPGAALRIWPEWHKYCHVEK